MIVVDAVYVVEDEAHTLPAPHLVLAAQFAASLLQPFCQEAPLQVPTAVGRARDHDLFERTRLA
jgi:hypothetical protein